ncbi:unnamed protein product [Closterium sp. NIES-53]
MHCPARRALPCSQRASLLSARCPVRHALPYSLCAALLATCCPACCALPCPALCPLAALPCSLRVALPCSQRTALPCSPRVSLPCIPCAILPCSSRASLPCSPRAALPCSLRAALPCSPRIALPCSLRAALPCSSRAALPCSPGAALPCNLRAALPYSPHAALPCSPRAALPCPAARPLHCPAVLPARPAARVLPCPAATTASTATATAAATAVASDALAPLLLTATAYYGHYQSRSSLREWVIQLGRPGGEGYVAGGTRQQSQPETPSPQQPREWLSQRRVSGSVGAAALGASESAAALGVSETAATGASESGASAEALHTFALDFGASHCFLHDCTTVTPLVAPVPVSLADPSGSLVVARASTVLPCPAVPSGSLSGLYLPSFSTNLVSNPVLQDVWVDTFTPGGQRVAICQVAASSQVSASGQLPTSCSCRHAAPHSSSFPPTTSLLQTLHMDVWDPTPVHGTDQERYFLLVVDDYTCYTTAFPLRCKADVRGFSSDLLAEFCRDEVIVQSFTLSASSQQNGIAERRIGLIMEVVRTSMIHVAAPHFLWPFAVRYAAHQLNLWPRVSLPETSPTLRWTGEDGNASAFRVWGTLSIVRDTSASKLSPCTLRCAFLGFPTNAPPWQFYRLHPHTSHPVDPPPLVDPLVISSVTSGPAEGGDPAVDDTTTTHRSPRLETPPGFLLRPSSPPLQPVAVDNGAAGGGDTGGEDAGGTGPRVAETGGAEIGGARSGVLTLGVLRVLVVVGLWVLLL